MLLRLNDGTIDTGAAYIDFEASLVSCGQAFRFKKDIESGVITGVARGAIIHITQDANGASINITTNDYHNAWRGYFALDDDYSPLYSAAKTYNDGFLRDCLSYYYGLRVLRQEFWEALVTFIVSQNNNIPRIRLIIERLCAAYGDDLGVAFAFPPPEALAAIDGGRLANTIGAGYRGEYIVCAARACAGGAFERELAGLSHEGRIAELLKIKGVGVKVANCAALFGLHSLEAFPVDVWIERVINKAYGGALDYSRFAPVAGVAQQYMFRYALAHKDEFK